MIPTRRSLQRGADAKAAEYIRGHWRLELLRRTIDDSFKDVDLVVLPTRRRTPRTVGCVHQARRDRRAAQSELENTGAFNFTAFRRFRSRAALRPPGFPSG